MSLLSTANCQHQFPLYQLIQVHKMINTEAIKKLSKEEKLKMMEAIWFELLNEEESIKSPDWHNDELKKTEKRLLDGQEEVIEWAEAKKELRKRFE